MPTENEKKYVLNRMDASEVAEILWHGYSLVQQGYLAKRKKTVVRVRMVESTVKGRGRKKFFLTVKTKCGNRVIENEMEIPKRDFDDYWKMCGSKLRKIRAHVADWEIDFFLRGKKDKKYFILAEIEMPEGKQEPDEIPEVIRKHIAFAVPMDDDRFSSKRLSDSKYAEKLWEEICGPDT